MAMISGPYTDAVVKMLMGDDGAFAEGDVLINAQGQYGVLFRREVWIADPVVRVISAEEFGVRRAEAIRFPEPFEDTFRFTEGDGNIWIPEYRREDKEFLRQSGYFPATPQKTLSHLEKEKGNPQHKLFPLSCRIGVWEESAAAEVARILMHLYD